MEEDIYNYLEAKISDLVEDLNNDLNLLEHLKRKKYHTSVPSLDEFNNHDESIEISYDSNIIKMQSFGYPRGRPLMASIRKGDGGGLDGIIYDNDKRNNSFSCT